jgi:hypothetical protein
MQFKTLIKKAKWALKNKDLTKPQKEMLKEFVANSDKVKETQTKEVERIVKER